MPKELEETRAPMEIISEKEYKIQEENIANGNSTEEQKKFGISRKLTQKLSNQYIKKFGSNNWYDWKRINWGTKWDVTAELISETENELVYTFQTAWSPPTEFIIKVSKLFPNLNFTMEYLGEGNEFAGLIECQNGDFTDTEIEPPKTCSCCGEDGTDEVLDDNGECASCIELNQ